MGITDQFLVTGRTGIVTGASSGLGVTLPMSSPKQAPTSSSRRAGWTAWRRWPCRRFRGATAVSLLNYASITQYLVIAEIYVELADGPGQRRPRMRERIREVRSDENDDV